MFLFVFIIKQRRLLGRKPSSELDLSLLSVCLIICSSVCLSVFLHPNTKSPVTKRKRMTHMKTKFE